MAKPKVESPFVPAPGKFIAQEIVVESKESILLPESLKPKRMMVLESALEGVEKGDHLVIDAAQAFQIVHDTKTYWIFGQNDYCAKWKK